LLRSNDGIRSVSLPTWLQAMFVVAGIATFAGVSFLTVGYFTLQRTVDQLAQSAPAAVATPATALAASQDELNRQLAELNDQYNALKTRYDDEAAKLAGLANAQLQPPAGSDKSRDDLEQRLHAAEQAMATRNGNVAQLQKAIDDLRGELKRSDADRQAQLKHVQQVETDLKAAKIRADLLKALADSKDQQLRQAIGERDKVRAQSGEKSSMNEQLGSAPVAAPAPQQQSALDEDQDPLVDASSVMASVPPKINASASQLERVLASTGVDLDKILSHLGVAPSAQGGGPFIALDRAASQIVDPRREAELQKLVKTMPLASPLNRFEVESPFGPRRDPINGRAAFHPGLDLGAPYLSAVYSTGPGVVAFTGVKGAYGRVVEIDHGHGMVTRYAHLHRILVARGQHVGTHQQVGELGSTGRSTGPHLHYEVLVDGRPADPARFLEAGKNVVQASTR